jgi:hypothetical protein
MENSGIPFRQQNIPVGKLGTPFADRDVSVPD